MANPISKVPFFTPVESNQYPLIKVFDYCFWFGGEVAVQIEPDSIRNSSHGCRRQPEVETTLIATIVKIAAYLLFLKTAMCLFAVKCAIRCLIDFHWDQLPSSTTRMMTGQTHTIPMSPVHTTIGLSNSLLNTQRSQVEQHVPNNELYDDENEDETVTNPNTLSNEAAHRILNPEQQIELTLNNIEGLLNCRKGLQQEISQFLEQGRDCPSVLDTQNRLEQALNLLPRERIIEDRFHRSSLVDPLGFHDDSAAYIRHLENLTTPPTDLESLAGADLIEKIMELDAIGERALFGEIQEQSLTEVVNVNSSIAEDIDHFDVSLNNVDEALQLYRSLRDRITISVNQNRDCSSLVTSMSNLEHRFSEANTREAIIEHCFQTSDLGYENAAQYIQRLEFDDSVSFARLSGLELIETLLYLEQIVRNHLASQEREQFHAATDAGLQPADVIVPVEEFHEVTQIQEQQDQEVEVALSAEERRARDRELRLQAIQNRANRNNQVNA